MLILSKDEVTQTILKHGPLTPEELARMAYPVRVAYLALMLSWVREHGLDNLIEQKEALRSMALRGLKEAAGSIDGFRAGRSGSRSSRKVKAGAERSGRRRKEVGDEE